MGTGSPRGGEPCSRPPTSAKPPSWTCSCTLHCKFPAYSLQRPEDLAMQIFRVHSLNRPAKRTSAPEHDEPHRYQLPAKLEVEPNCLGRGNLKTQFPCFAMEFIYPRDTGFVFVAVLVFEIDHAPRPDHRPLPSMKIHGASSSPALRGCRPSNHNTTGHRHTRSVVWFSIPLRMIGHDLQFLILVPL